MRQISYGVSFTRGEKASLPASERSPERAERGFSTVRATCPHLGCEVRVWDAVEHGVAIAPEPVVLYRAGARHHALMLMAQKRECSCFEAFWAEYGPEYIFEQHAQHAELVAGNVCTTMSDRPLRDSDVTTFGPGVRRASHS
jgi:hypothetical protein